MAGRPADRDHSAVIRDVTIPLDTSDPSPRFVGVAGVKPRAATAEGGLGLTPVMSTQASSAIGGSSSLATPAAETVHVIPNRSGP
jgi:hypothetical protein